MHWYVLSKATGTATLCAGEHDARREARSYDRLYPRAAPHVAVQLVPVLDTASSDAVGRDVALALEWARANAGEHADTIIEALAAYDPERVGARTVAKPAQGAEFRTLVAQPFTRDDAQGLDAPQATERRAVTNEDVRRACDAWDRSKMAGANRVAVHMRAALESFAGVPAAQPADEIADLTKRLAAAQRPFDPDVAEVIRKGWDTLFDDAQPAPDAGEPVAWRYKLNAEKPEQWAVVQQWPLQFDGYEDREKWTIEPLYTHPASAASEAADAQLADTQRAIIEAAEARGYARAKTEWEADARDESVEWVDSEWPMQVVRAARADDPSWLWWKNNRCKYIELRIDTRDGHCVIKDRNGKIISLATLCKQTGEPDFALAAQQRKGG